MDKITVINRNTTVGRSYKILGRKNQFLGLSLLCEFSNIKNVIISIILHQISLSLCFFCSTSHQAAVKTVLGQVIGPFSYVTFPFISAHLGLLKPSTSPYYNDNLVKNGPTWT